MLRAARRIVMAARKWEENMSDIAATATIDPRAQLGNNLTIAPGCYIGPDVTIGDNCILMPNTTIIGNTQIGSHNIFYPSTVIGAAPQDLKFKGGNTKLVIGDHNIFRECVTAHLGTEIGGGLTSIGSHNQFQVGSHIAHDVIIGSHCILSNQVQIAGHVQIEDHVVVSGLAGVQQFVTLGAYSFIAGAARCTADTPPYVIFGHDGVVAGVNVKGLSRWGFSEVTIQQLRELCKLLFPKRNTPPSDYRIRNLYGMFASRSKNNTAAAATLAKRIREADARSFTDEHCQYLLSFMKRSMHGGVHGRYLESHRRDNSSPPPEFYRRLAGAEGAAKDDRSASAARALDGGSNN